jgi:uncharacterized repeat protein (TIGR03803 family)
LIQASDGNFYGVTGQGGANNDGTVFKLTPSGILTTLHSFDGTDGSSPAGSLVQGPNGKLYGITTLGGNTGAFCNGGSGTCGTVFEITMGGTFKTLHKFSSTDGANHYGALLLATDGNFYGTTQFGNPNNAGTIFQITPAGKFTTIYNFCSQQFCLDGVRPVAGLMQATNGTLYGTTADGGTQTNGIVYSLSMGLGPFVQPMPTAGRIGSKLFILGNNLTSTTSVTFNGTTAVFTVVSDTEITATVPSGATTGKIQVVTPSGTLKSNVPFRVSH